MKHLSYRTEGTYVSWVKRFILFHNKRHPREMGSQEVRSFLSHLETERPVAASTQPQTPNAFVFLYLPGWQKSIWILKMGPKLANWE